MQAMSRWHSQTLSRAHSQTLKVYSQHSLVRRWMDYIHKQKERRFNKWKDASLSVMVEHSRMRGTVNRMVRSIHAFNRSTQMRAMRQWVECVRYMKMHDMHSDAREDVMHQGVKRIVVKWTKLLTHSAFKDWVERTRARALFDRRMRGMWCLLDGGLNHSLRTGFDRWVLWVEGVGARFEGVSVIAKRVMGIYMDDLRARMVRAFHTLHRYSITMHTLTVVRTSTLTHIISLLTHRMESRLVRAWMRWRLGSVSHSHTESFKYERCLQGFKLIERVHGWWVVHSMRRSLYLWRVHVNTSSSILAGCEVANDVIALHQVRVVWFKWGQWMRAYARISEGMEKVESILRSRVRHRMLKVWVRWMGVSVWVVNRRGHAPHRAVQQWLRVLGLHHTKSVSRSFHVWKGMCMQADMMDRLKRTFMNSVAAMDTHRER